MKNKSALSSSGMFLSELLIAILVFAVAAAVCLQIFVYANLKAEESSTLNRAVVAAQNAAECFKAASGDLGLTAEFQGPEAVTEENAVILFFDADWHPVSDSNGKYMVQVQRISKIAGCIRGEVTVLENLADTSAESKELYSLTVSALVLDQAISSGESTGSGVAQ